MNLLKKRRSYIISLALFGVCLMTNENVRADDSLDVNINQPSVNIIEDNYGNPYVIVGEDSDGLTFDCDVSPDGDNLYYDWSSGGDPSSNDDNTDSSYGPVSFTEGGTLNVDVTLEDDAGNTCSTGSDSLTVSYITMTFDSQGTDNDGNEIVFYIPDDAEIDEDGNIETRCDITISADSGLTSVDLGTLSTDEDKDSFLDDSDNDVTDAILDDSGSVTVTLDTTDNVIDKNDGVNIYIN